MLPQRYAAVLPQFHAVLGGADTCCLRQLALSVSQLHPPPVRSAPTSSALARLQLKQHAMYVVVNMASSTSAHKGAVMASGWPALLVQQLRCVAEASASVEGWAGTHGLQAGHQSSPANRSAS